MNAKLPHDLFTAILIILVIIGTIGCGILAPAPTPTLIPTETPVPTSIKTPVPTPTDTPRATPIGGGGGLIAYYANMPYGATEIRIYDVSTGADRALYYDQTVKYSFSWSPDNKSILFQSGFPSSVSQISMIDVDGTNLRAIKGDDTSLYWTPSLSPDGKKIAFTSKIDNGNDPFCIYTMNVDGTELRKLTEFYSTNPQWSPDGTRMVFQGKVEGSYEIFKINLDGSDLVNLTNYPGNDMAPMWSPDGRYISFTSGRDSPKEKTNIFIMNPDGSGVVNLTNDPNLNSDSSWSPDSRYLVFTSNRSGAYQLYMIEIENPIAVLIPLTSEEVGYPAWSH